MSFLGPCGGKKFFRLQEKFPVFGVVFFFFTIFLFNFLFSSSVSAATPPSIITYQGKLLNAGTAVNATTSIQLRIYDDPSAGTLLYTAGGIIGAPAAISVPVDNGIFSVNMGAAGTNAVTSTILADNSALYLEVWVEGNQMSPRKRLNATPYAINSAYLMGYAAATSSNSTYIPVSDSNGNFNFFGSLIATGTATSSFTNVLVNDGITLGGEKRTTWPSAGIGLSDNNAFTGSNTFNSTTVINGQAKGPRVLGTLTDNTKLSGDSAVVVRGDYAYVTSFLGDRFTVVDISSSTKPVILSSLAGGTGLSILDRPVSLDVSGNYAYVGSYFGNSIEVIDISNPTSTVTVGSVSNALLMGGVRSVKISGNYLYVAAADVDSLTVVDVSNPRNPVIVASLSDASTVEPWSIDISGNYAFLASETGDSMTMIDISDPRKPVVVNFVSDGGGASPFLDGAHAVAVSGKYAYVGSTVSNKVQILDISDPSSIVPVGSYDGTGASIWGQVVSLVPSGNYLYVYASTGMIVVDISNPATPTFFSDVSLESGNEFLSDKALAIRGNKVYATNYSTNKFLIVNVAGASITNADVGNAGIFNLDVRNSAVFGKDLNIQGGVQIGNSGLLLNGSFAMGLSTSSLFATNSLHFSHTALFESFASSTSRNAFIFNTANTFSNVSSTYLFSVRNNGTPAFSIASNGNVHATGSYYGVSANLGTPGAPGDLAERVDIALDDTVEPGDVVVVDPNSTDTYRRSNSPYAQEVSGVISTNPTIVVGDGKTEHTAVMAMVGRVPIKVSTENGPIVRGDLLITASSTGYAMRYDPVKDGNGQIAGIVGVALESLANGKAKIMGLVRTGWVNGQDQQTFTQLRSEIAKISLGQTNNTELDVTENTDGSIAHIDSDLNLNGFSLLAVRSIQGLNEKWEIDEEGRFITKVDTSEGAKTLYALQAGESQYVFSGSAALVNGRARIDFDETILDIVNTKKPMNINLTLTQKAKGIYVSSRDETGFDVEEVGGGESNATFDWLIFATRKNAVDVEEETDKVSQPPEDETPNDENTNNENTEESLDTPPAQEEENSGVSDVPVEQQPVVENDEVTSTESQTEQVVEQTPSDSSPAEENTDVPPGPEEAPPAEAPAADVGPTE